MARISTRASAKLVRSYDESSSGSEESQPSTTQKRRRTALNAAAGSHSTDSNSSNSKQAQSKAALQSSAPKSDTKTSTRRASTRGAAAAPQGDSNEVWVEAASGSSKQPRGKSRGTSTTQATSVEANDVEADDSHGDTSLDIPKLDASSIGSGRRWPAEYELALVHYIASDPEMRKWATGDNRGGAMLEGLQRFSELIHGPDAGSIYQRVCRWRAKHKVFVPLLTPAAQTSPTSTWTHPSDLELLERHVNAHSNNWQRNWHDTVHIAASPDAAPPASATTSPRRKPRAAAARSAASASRDSSDSAGAASESRSGLSLAARAAMVGILAPPGAPSAASSSQQASKGAPVMPRPSAPSSLVAAAPAVGPASGFRTESPYVSTQTQLENHTREIAQLKAESRQLRLSLSQQTDICMRQSKQLERQAEQMESQTTQITQQGESMQELKHQVDFLYALVRERTGASPDPA